jgi:hypothetical protein
MKEGEMDESWAAQRLKIALVLAGLAIIVYLPAQSLPLIWDDYGQIHFAREFGPVSGWRALAADPLYRCRATSLVLTYWTDRIFGVSVLAFNLSSLGLHILNVWLVFALGAWKKIGWRQSAVAAAFFAVYEGHQEAVMWYAAIHELLHLLFALLCVLSWLRWLESKRLGFLGGSFCFYIIALLSKESAVAIVPLLILLSAVEREKWRRVVLAAFPFAAVAAGYFLLIYANRATHLHFNDAGTFSLQAPFWITWPKSMGRLFWIWGWLGVLALIVWRDPGRTRLAVLGAAWAGIALLPYCFLTYMTRVPSRHTYFAAVGLAVVVSAAFWKFQERFQRRPWLSWALAAVIVIHNCAYLWVRKQAQFLDRAALTEHLVIFAAGVEGPVFIHCFPGDVQIAEWAVELRLHKRAYPLISGRPLSEIKDRSNVFCCTPREHWGRTGQAHAPPPFPAQTSMLGVPPHSIRE